MRQVLGKTLVTLACCAPLTASSGQDAEVALAHADSYTVLVRTVIRHPFGDDTKGRSFGAGFVIDRKHGWILTNAHVASRSQATITAKFRNGEPIPAKRIYVDPFLDLAVLAIPPASMPGGSEEAKLDCGELPKAGIPVVAYGHPGGLYFTGTKGIVSGVSAKYDNELLQTDAPINRGNSGGPLINLMSGRIAGVNTASISGMQNTSFALASRYACPIVDMLRDGKDPSPPKTDWVFFSGIEETSQLKVAKAGQFGERLGIQPGDIIVSANDSDKLENETQLLHAMRGRLDHISITVERDGKRIKLHGRAEAEPSILDRQALFASGMLLTEFDERWSLDIRLDGVMVGHVDKGSAADLADIASGTMLVSVNGVPTPNLDAAQDALAAAARVRKEAVLVFKRLDGNANAISIYSWRERRVTISDIKIIRAGDKNQPI